MSVGELNQLMTYVVDGWMLFSAGFIGIEFVSFVSRRIQEDIEADAVALANQQSAAVGVAETAEVSVTETVKDEALSAVVQTPHVSTGALESSVSPPLTMPKTEAEVPKAGPAGDESADDAESESPTAEDLSVEDAARLEEVAAVSEQLAKTKNKQSDSSSVSVST